MRKQTRNWKHYDLYAINSLEDYENYVVIGHNDCNNSGPPGGLRGNFHRARRELARYPLQGLIL